MIITRFGRDYTRRKFLADASRGVLATGVLAPLAKTIAATGEVSKAYPDELLSIEGYTKGKIKTGDYITYANVEQACKTSEWDLTVNLGWTRQSHIKSPMSSPHGWASCSYCTVDFPSKASR